MATSESTDRQCQLATIAMLMDGNGMARLLLLTFSCVNVYFHPSGGPNRPPMTYALFA
jgi:hypothetical protein